MPIRLDDQLLHEIDNDAELEERSVGAPGCRMRERAQGIRELVRAARLARRRAVDHMECYAASWNERGDEALRILRGDA